jgi:hypothetical protein
MLSEHIHIPLAPLTPPQALPIWKHTVQDIDKFVTEALEKKVSDVIVKLPEDKVGFDNVSTVSIPPAHRKADLSISCVCEFTWV